MTNIDSANVIIIEITYVHELNSKNWEISRKRQSTYTLYRRIP